jgi:2-oxoglutarate dehydrogenase E2 component (dihydrolipoamide succinyltransferase)
MSELIDILIPDDQKEGTELEMGAWLKQVGDPVTKDEPVAELVTDKAVVEIPSPASGTLAEVLVPTESSVSFDAVLGRIDPSGVPTAAPAAAAEEGGDDGSTTEDILALTSQRTDRPPPHPAVLRRAAQLGIRLDAVTGTGKDGRVTRHDLERFGATSASTGAPPVQTPAAPPDHGALGPSRIIRHDPMRRSIARNMANSVITAPHVTAVFDCDLSAVIRDREERKEALAARSIKLTYSAYFLQATVAALREVPEVNSRWTDEGLQLFEHIHVGVGAALEDRGLVVPVVRNVQDLDLEGCAAELTRLTEKARSGKLTPADMKGSTFTISNHGVMGSLLASPIIIQQPESAILGIGKLEKRPVVVTQDGDDRVDIRPLLYVTLTIDHRALDAFHTNRFLTTFCQTLENWGG